MFSSAHALALFGLALLGALAPLTAAAASPVLRVDTTTGPVGTKVGLSAATPCPPPAGAGEWVAIVSFAQGGNGQVSFANYQIAPDGSWGGQFTIPTVAVPGAAQLKASCFDASPGVTTSVDYAPVDFEVTPSKVVALPTSGSVGTVVDVTPTPCPAPPGARNWTAIVAFAQGGNGEVSFANYQIAPDGSWGGTFTIPSAAVPGPAQLVADCFEASGGASLHYTPVNFTVTPSTLNAHEDNGPAGTVFGLSPTICPMPAGARAWTAIVMFAQGGNAEVSFANYAVGADGSWSGTFTIPSAAVLGLAQLNAACFDASPGTLTTVNYASENFLVTESTLSASPTSGPVGTQVSLSPDACPPPAGAGAWTSIVRFSQSGNPAVSFANYAIGADGSWTGSFTIPSAAAPGPAQLTGECFDPTHTVQTVLTYTPVNFVVTLSTLNASPTSGPVGTNVGLSPTVLTACPNPAGASDWVVVVDFAQGGNPAVSFANFLIGADGSWGGIFTIPVGAVPGPAQLTAVCFDAAHRVSTEVAFAPVSFLVTAAPVPTKADVAIAKTAAATVAPGSDLTYKIVVTNNGPDGATNVVVTDPLPSNESFVGISSLGAAGACAVPPSGTTGGTVVCHAFSLPGGQTAEWDVVVHVAANVPDATVLTNTARATADTPDVNQENNTATASTLVVAGGGTSGGTSGGTTGSTGGPGPTPELDSLLLFGSGLTGMAAYALRRLRGRRRG